MKKKTPEIALLCGGVPHCDRCKKEDAKILVSNMPKWGNMRLCNTCAISLLELGLSVPQMLDNMNNYLDKFEEEKFRLKQMAGYGEIGGLDDYVYGT